MRRIEKYRQRWRGGVAAPFVQVANPPTNINWLHGMNQSAAIVGNDHTGLQNGVSYFPSSTIPIGSRNVLDFRSSTGNGYININDSASTGLMQWHADIDIMLEFWFFVPSSAPTTGSGTIIGQYQPTFNRRSWRAYVLYSSNSLQFSYNPTPTTSGAPTWYAPSTPFLRDQWNLYTIQRERISSSNYRFSRWMNGEFHRVDVRTDRPWDNDIDWVKVGNNENAADPYKGFLGPVRCVQNELIYTEAANFPQPTAMWTAA